MAGRTPSLLIEAWLALVPCISVSPALSTQGEYDGCLETQLYRVQSGRHLLLPLPPYLPVALVPPPALLCGPLNRLLIAAQRVAPRCRPPAAEVAEWLGDLRTIVMVGRLRTGPVGVLEAQWRWRDVARLHWVLEGFFAVWNPAMLGEPARKIADYYVDRQVSSSDLHGIQLLIA